VVVLVEVLVEFVTVLLPELVVLELGVAVTLLPPQPLSASNASTPIVMADLLRIFIMISVSSCVVCTYIIGAIHVPI
jgi:hypothetical protein